MPENSSHAPGNEISGEGNAVRQRNRMGEGGAPMGGNFGVMPLAEANRSGGQSHGSAAPHDGVHLGDHERSGPPGINMGRSSMSATAHSNHGPHMHTMHGGKRGK